MMRSRIFNLLSATARATRSAPYPREELRLDGVGERERRFDGRVENVLRMMDRVEGHLAAAELAVRSCRDTMSRNSTPSAFCWEASPLYPLPCPNSSNTRTRASRPNL